MVDADELDRNAYAALLRDPNYTFASASQIISSFIFVSITPLTDMPTLLTDRTSVTLFCNHHSMNISSFNSLNPVVIDDTTYHECELRLPFDEQVKPENLEHFCILSAAENAPFIVHPSTMRSMLYLFSGGQQVQWSNPMDADAADDAVAANTAFDLTQQQLTTPDKSSVDRMLASFFTDAITRGRKKYLDSVLPVANKFWDSSGKNPKLKNTTACLLELLHCDVAYPLKCFDRQTDSSRPTVHVPLYRVASFKLSDKEIFQTGQKKDAMEGWTHRNKDHVLLNLSVRIDVVHKGKRFSILLAFDKKLFMGQEPTIKYRDGNVYYFIGEVMKMMYDPYFYTHLKNLFPFTQEGVFSDWLRSFTPIPDNLLVWILDLNCKVTQHIVKRSEEGSEEQRKIEHGFILTNTHSLPHIDHHGIQRLFYKSTDGTIWVLTFEPNQYRVLNIMRTEPTSTETTVLHVPANYIDLPTNITDQDRFLSTTVGELFSSMHFSLSSKQPTQSSFSLLPMTDQSRVTSDLSQYGIRELPPGIKAAGPSSSPATPVINPDVTATDVINELNRVDSHPSTGLGFFSMLRSVASPMVSSATSVISSLFSFRFGGAHGGRRVLHHHSLNKSKKRRGRRTVRMYYRPGLSYRKISRRARGRSRRGRGRSRRNPKN